VSTTPATLWTLFRIGPALSVACWFALLAAQAAAGNIHYKWSGTLLPSGPEDPWLIGETGMPFELEITVAKDSVDLAEVDPQFAIFAVDRARLAVAGREILYAGDGFLDFTDNSLIGYDLLSFRGIFDLGGVQSAVPSFVDLPLHAFQFVAPTETPPVFGSMANVLRSSTGALYSTIVEAGSLVRGVPEQKSMSLAFVAFAISLLAVRKSNSFRVYCKHKLNRRKVIQLSSS
jgi:hypothetical protein